MKKQSLLLASAIAATLTSGVAIADLTANAAVSNNYIWRGMTQTNDFAAVSGGVDFSDDNGIYAGSWVSNLGFGPATGQELDIYGGFGLELADEMTLDVGGVIYYYTIAPSTSFTEVYANLGVKNITIGAAMTLLTGSANDNVSFDTGDIYASVEADFDNVTVYGGAYLFSNDGNAGAQVADYIHYGASVVHEDLTFAIDKNDVGGVAGRMRISVGWSKGWEL